MKIDEAEKILMEHRPYQPRKMEQKRFQKAIDVILDFLKDFPSDDVIQKSMSKTYTERLCAKCKHSAKLITEEPCMICDRRHSKWEASDE